MASVPNTSGVNYWDQVKENLPMGVALILYPIMKITQSSLTPIISSLPWPIRYPTELVKSFVEGAPLSIASKLVDSLFVDRLNGYVLERLGLLTKKPRNYENSDSSQDSNLPCWLRNPYLLHATPSSITQASFACLSIVIARAMLSFFPFFADKTPLTERLIPVTTYSFANEFWVLFFRKAILEREGKRSYEEGLQEYEKHLQEIDKKLADYSFPLSTHEIIDMWVEYPGAEELNPKELEILQYLPHMLSLTSSHFLLYCLKKLKGK